MPRKHRQRTRASRIVDPSQSSRRRAPRELEGLQGPAFFETAIYMALAVCDAGDDTSSSVGASTVSCCVVKQCRQPFVVVFVETESQRQKKSWRTGHSPGHRTIHYESLKTPTSSFFRDDDLHDSYRRRRWRWPLLFDVLACRCRAPRGRGMVVFGK